VDYARDNFTLLRPVCASPAPEGGAAPPPPSLVLGTAWAAIVGTCVHCSPPALPPPQAGGLRRPHARAKDSAVLLVAAGVAVALFLLGLPGCGAQCPAGRYREGPNCMVCPAGRWGTWTNLTSPDCQGSCAGGRYGISLQPWYRDVEVASRRASSLCDGQCPAGFACPAGTNVTFEDLSTGVVGVPCARARGLYSHAGATICRVIDDAYLLQEFYIAANGNTWLRRDNWLTGSPCDPAARWFGVECTSVAGVLRVT
jgi:hypothetical protein